MRAETWKAKAELILAQCAREKRVILYKDLAAEAMIPPPQTIHQLTGFLEDLTRIDVQLGQPIRAAVVVSRATSLPGDGFFEHLITLNQDENLNRHDWHQKLLAELFKAV